MKKFTLECRMDTAAFAQSPQLELARILADLAAKILLGEMQVCPARRLYDRNGIQVGAASIEVVQ